MNKKKGFTLIELMVSLVITATIGTLIYEGYSRTTQNNKRQVEAQKMITFSKAVGNYISAYQTLAYSKLPTPNLNLTISPEALEIYGYIPKNQYSGIIDPNTNEILYPCATIYYFNNKLQGYIYYRTDAKNSTINPKSLSQLEQGIKVIGGDSGIFLPSGNTYMIKSKNQSLILTSAQVSNYFNQKGVDFLDSTNNSCKGKYIATPSFNLHLSNVLNQVNSQLNEENTVKQNSNEILNSNQTNKIDELNLDSTGISGTAWNGVQQNKLIFQSNPNCQMNPSILSTMQDYAPSNATTNPKNCSSLTTSKDCENYSFPNPFGCRNKQLTLGVQSATVSNGASSKLVQAVVINGFNKVDTSYQTQQSSNYLGSLNADTIQATATVEYGSKCDISEIGALAKQIDYSTKSDNISKLYSLNQNLMVCQKNMLCAGSTKSNVQICWLPLTPINATINFTQSNHVLAFHAPTGFYIRSIEYYDIDPSIHVMSYGDNAIPYRGSIGPQSSGATSFCDKSVDDWFCHKNTNGHIANLAAPYQHIYFPYAALNPQTKISVNDWETWSLSNVGLQSLTTNTMTYYFTSCTGSRGSGGGISAGCPLGVYSQGDVNTINTQKYNVTHAASAQFEQASLPKYANPRYSAYQTGYGNGGGGGGCGRMNDCDGWENGWVAIMPNYIKTITISNDTSSDALDDNYLPGPTPPDPTGSCVSIPSDINDTALSSARATKTLDGTTQVVYIEGSVSITAQKSPNGLYCTAKATGKYCSATPECQTFEGSWMLCENGHANYPIGYTCEIGSTVSARGNCVQHSALCTDAGLRVLDQQGLTHGCRTYQPVQQCSNPTTSQIYQEDYAYQ